MALDPFAQDILNRCRIGGDIGRAIVEVDAWVEAIRAELG